MFFIKNVESNNTVTLRFTNSFNVEQMRSLNPQLLDAIFKFKIEPNKEFDELLERSAMIRNASISKWKVISVGENEVKVQLFFKDVEAISQGGVNYQDSLAVWIAELELIKFQ